MARLFGWDEEMKDSPLGMVRRREESRRTSCRVRVESGYISQSTEQHMYRSKQQCWADLDKANLQHGAAGLGYAGIPVAIFVCMYICCTSKPLSTGAGEIAVRQGSFRPSTPSTQRIPAAAGRR